MKNFITLTLLTILLSGLCSCRTKPVAIVFQSNQKDSATGLGQRKVYKLKQKAIGADFNYSKLNDIDGNIKDTLNLKNLMPIFEPTSGDYSYYQFISTFKGMVCCDDSSLEVFHDILIIKTNNENKIIDAYQYTLEWGEPPLQFDLYKSHVKNIALTNYLGIGALNLTRQDFWDENDRILKEDGQLKLE